MTTIKNTSVLNHLYLVGVVLSCLLLRQVHVLIEEHLHAIVTYSSYRRPVEPVADVV